MLSATSANPLSILAGVTVSGSGYGLYATSSGPTWTITNLGTITASTGDGVTLNAGGALTNSGTAARIAGGFNGVVAGAATDTIVNQGTISGTGHGVVLDGGMLINSGTDATIYGAYGVVGTTFTVINQGSISGTAGDGVQLPEGGAVTNDAAATITGTNDGVRALFIAGNITNQGSINGTSVGVSLQQGGTVINTGVISGGADAVLFGTSVSGRLVADPGGSFSGTVDGGNTIGASYASTLELASGASAGTITGLGAQFIDFATVTIDSGAAWTLASEALGAGYTVYDSGTLTNAGSLGVSVTLGAGAELTNSSGGVIAGGAGGVYGFGAATVANDGSISGASLDGVNLVHGGVLTNGAAGSISGAIGAVGGAGGASTFVNQGSISGTAAGVSLRAGTLANIGSTAQISGGSVGISIFAGSDTVTNQGTISSSSGEGVRFNAGGTLTNSGTAALISGGAYGVYAKSGVAIVTNSGSIAGGSDGLKLAAGGTVVNAGAISGGSDAVLFGAGSAGRLVVYSGAVFSGTVDGGNAIGSTIVSTLELASGASAGTLAGLGGQFVDFAQVTLDAGASWSLTNAALVAGATLTALAGSHLSDTGTLANYGAVVLDPSTAVLGGLIGSGGVTIDAGSVLDALGTVGSGQTISFYGSGGYLHLYQPTNAAGGVVNFAAGDTIDLAGVNPASVSYSAGALSFAGGAFPLEVTSGDTLVTSASADGTELTALCFVVGTMILTPSGERRVQDLVAGDLVTTASGAARPIAWVGAGKVLATRGRRNAATPVIVRKNAIAPNVPNRDLHVTKGHCLYIDDVFIPVEFLVNHRSIAWDDRAQEVELYHVELETHDVLVANGARAESYRDDGNRWLFRNANAGWALPDLEPCAPILTGGPVVDAAWRRLLERSGTRSGVPLTGDADLHLLVDGRRVDAKARHGAMHVFRLPTRPAAVRIVSRAAIPQELGTARDPRMLGIALRQIMLTQGTRSRPIEAGDVRLADGFHAFEPDNGFCWTNGDAAVPMELFEGLNGAIDLHLTVAMTAHYIDEGEARRVA